MGKCCKTASCNVCACVSSLPFSLMCVLLRLAFFSMNMHFFFFTSAFVHFSISANCKHINCSVLPLCVRGGKICTVLFAYLCTLLCVFWMNVYIRVRRVLRNAPFSICNCVSAFSLGSMPVCMWLLVSAARRSSVTCMLTGKWLLFKAGSGRDS